MIGSLGVIIAIFVKAAVSDQCSHGDIRLVNGTTLQEGRLEICYHSNWGTVCQDNWGNKDSFVVCRQLGYQENAGRSIGRAYFGQGKVPVVWGNVGCNGRELELLRCSHDAPSYCARNNIVSVQCMLRDDQRIKNMMVSANVNIKCNTPSTVTVHTALISWVLYNTTVDEPTSFDVECSNEQHSIKMSVSGQDFTTHLVGLLPLSSYNCCVSAVYEFYRAEGVCDDIETPELFIGATTTILRANSDHDSDAKLVGGVLGFIIMILLILLMISGAALHGVFATAKMEKEWNTSQAQQNVESWNFCIADNTSQRSRTSPEAPTSKRSAAEMAINKNDIVSSDSEMIVNGNISYETIAYSNPSSRQQPLPSGRNRVRLSANLSENNYVIEYLEPHQATGGGREKDEAQHEDYLQLQH